MHQQIDYFRIGVIDMLSVWLEFSSELLGSFKYLVQQENISQKWLRNSLLTPMYKKIFTAELIPRKSYQKRGKLLLYNKIEL